jgi:hypothetical protein
MHITFMSSLQSKIGVYINKTISECFFRAFYGGFDRHALDALSLGRVSRTDPALA